MENLAQLEALCESLYKSQVPAEREYVEDTLACFSRDPNCIPQLNYILENARNQYATLFASSSLVKHVTENQLPLQLRLQIRNHVLSYLATRGADLENFVLISLIQLLCRVTKLGWLEDDVFGELVKDSMNFLNQEAQHYAIGLRVLKQLVSEMNQQTPGLSNMERRKISNVFKDRALLQIYEISLSVLLRLKSDAQPELQELVLSLSLQCLSFDFAGLLADESTDEIGATEIPNSWKTIIEESSTIQIYFEYYAVTSPPVSTLSLECLLLLASVRKGLFIRSSDAHMKLSASLMMGTKDILETGRGLNDHDNYHHFCRLLGSLKVNIELSKLMSMEGFNTWISLVADFTLKSLQSWKWASSSVYYLLGLWSRMVTLYPYLKRDFPGTVELDELVPKILEGFISSHLDSLQAHAGVSDDPAEDPLDKIEQMQDQLDFFPHLCRFQYGKCSTYIMNSLDPLLQAYMIGVNHQDHVVTSNLALMETKLAWIVHIVGAVMRRKDIIGGESDEVIDAELSARVFQLINVMDTGAYTQRYGELSRQRLERAVLSFFQCFRKTCVGGPTMHACKLLYVRLSELLGLHDDALVLDVMVRKITTNLKCLSESEEVLDQTLSLFLEMTLGHSAMRQQLLKLDAVQLIIANHKREHFHFLEDHSSRGRTEFYYALGLLVFMEDSSVKFKQFMDPFSQILVTVESTPDPVLRNEAVKGALVGLLCDLRGIAMATNSCRTYCFLFDWLYPTRISVLLRAIVTWADTPEMMNPLLKFVAELVVNRSTRLSFEISSPNGIILFREVSKLLVAYGTRILTLPRQRDVYTTKYKGIWISLDILSRVMAGKYVNFGVFELYGDRALADALDVTLKLILSIPAADVFKYRKVAGAYFSFLEIVLEKYVRFALDLDARTFEYIVGSLHSGLKILESNLISKCAAAVDHLATFYFEHIVMGDSPPSPALLTFAQHVSNCADVFLEILKTLFEIVLFEDRGIPLSFFRAMLSLTLISEEMYTKLKTQIVSSQPVGKQQYLLQCFDSLMSDVTRSLGPKNREKFTQNVKLFKKEFRGK